MNTATKKIAKAPDRPHVDFVDLDLPAPVSTNDLWTIRRNSKTGAAYLAKTPEYSAWLELAGHAINRQKPGKVPGWYNLSICVPTSSRVDLGNAEKAISDLLQSHGVIENDRYCASIELGWWKGDGLLVDVWRTTAPAGKKEIAA